MAATTADDFSRWLSLSLQQWPGGLSDERESEFTEVIRNVSDLLRQREPPWRNLPPLFYAVFGRRGWKWNGFYVRRGSSLHLAEGAAGPPVCSSLEQSDTGALYSSGACWDALLMNQTIVLGDVSQWPGYVSCDGESSLKTVAGIICPIRDRGGRPIAVWDLDSEEQLAPEDAVFMGRLFDTLSVLLDPTASDFLDPGQ